MNKTTESIIKEIVAGLPQDPDRLMLEISAEEVKRFKDSVIWKLILTDLVERYDSINNRVNALTFSDAGIITTDYETTIAMRAQLHEIEFLLTDPVRLLEDLQAHEQELAKKEKSDGRRDVSGR